jgi:hypothetical protein
MLGAEAGVSCGATSAACLPAAVAMGLCQHTCQSNLIHYIMLWSECYSTALWSRCHVSHAQMDSSNVTTIRYTLPRSVAQAGCQLYAEGHFSIPASLLGPQEVHGESARPRTYTILEVVGCSPGGSLPETGAVEATLKVRPGWQKLMSIQARRLFVCAPDHEQSNSLAAYAWRVPMCL